MMRRPHKTIRGSRVPMQAPKPGKTNATRRLVGVNTPSKLHAKRSNRYQEEARKRLNAILTTYPLQRTIVNQFDIDSLSTDYGPKFAMAFFYRVKQLYKLRNAEEYTALNLPTIVRMLNDLLVDRSKQLNVYFRKQNMKDKHGQPRVCPVRTMSLCHLYIILDWLYTNENPTLKITRRTFYSETELDLKEIDCVVQLWARGLGHTFIANSTGIEMRRVRPLYRSLEEEYRTSDAVTGSEIAKLDLDNYGVTNKLWEWIRRAAQVVNIAGAEMYVVNKDSLEKQVLEIELAEKNKFKEEVVPPELPSDDDLEDSNDDAEITAPPAEHPDEIIDPMAPESYGVTNLRASRRDQEQDIPTIPMANNHHDEVDDLPASEIESSPVLVGETLAADEQDVEIAPSENFPPTQTMQRLPEVLSDEQPDQVNSAAESASTQPKPKDEQGQKLANFLKKS